MVATMASARSAFLISAELGWIGIPIRAMRMAGILKDPTMGRSASPVKVNATIADG